MVRHLLFAAAFAVVISGAPETSRAETHTLKIATVAPKGTPWASLLTTFKANVEKASGKRLRVRVFLGGTMGDENATVRETARGRLEGVGASTGAVASLVPELNAVEIPFMFRSAREADYVLDRVLLEPMEELFRERGLVLGFWSENGFRHFGSKRGKVSSPRDLRGRKMRSQESYVHLEMWKALSASPQAIPTTEVITALKTGAVDGFDQALLFAIAAGWHGEIQDLTLSGHIYQPAVIAFNRDWFDALPADLQRVLLDEGRKIVRQGREQIRALNPELIEIVKKAGVNVHTLSSAERADFERATARVRAAFRRSQGKSAARILDLVEKGVSDFRSRTAK
jgi:TRAP-type transport system periplasmic protein